MIILDFHTHRVTPINVVTPRSFGIHPWDTETVMVPAIDDKRWEGIEWVGECGIDRLRGASIERQAEAFEQQIEIAERLHKPIVIHCVKCQAELIALRRQHPALPWVLHGFCGGIPQAEMLRKEGIELSIGRHITTNSKVQECVKKLGKGEFLLETDDSDTDIHQIYQTAAQLIDCDIEELSDAIWAKYRSLTARTL